MTESAPINYFDRSKVFYPFIVNYICTLHGIIELCSRGFINELNEIHDEKVILELLEKLKIRKKEDFKKGYKYKTPLIGDMSLYSNFQENEIKVEIDEFAKELFKNFNYLLPYQIKAGGDLLISAYESTKQYNDKSPLWEFFRHCRNAAAHTGKFQFRETNLKKAEWGKLKITKILEGKNLFISNKNKKDGLLSLGDPIRLLWDIEQRLPHRANPSPLCKRPL